MARSNNDPKCIQHARFAAHLDRAHFDIIYWVLFIIVILMLFAASFRYGRSIDEVANLVTGSPEHKRLMMRCMLVCAIYAVVSVVAVVMEVFALMALQFCDGEDLMALYWSTWTVMQIGSLIAIFGVLLAGFHTIRGRKHPPWALALGTPVLVVAGLGHIVQGALRKKVKSVRRRGSFSTARLRRRSEDIATSTANTINHPEDSEKDELEYHYSAKLLGYTPDGATILQFCPPPSSSWSSSRPNPARLSSPSTQARIVGAAAADGQVIVAFRDGKATITAGPTSATERPPASSVPRSGPSVTIEDRTLPDKNKAGPPRSSRSSASESPAGGGAGDRTTSAAAAEVVKLGEPSRSGQRTPAPPSGGPAGVRVPGTRGTRSDSPPGAGGSGLASPAPRGAMSA